MRELIASYYEIMIELKNIKAGEIFYHSIIQIFGHCSDASESISIVHTDGSTNTTRIYNNYFKVIIKTQILKSIKDENLFETILNIKGFCQIELWEK